MDFMQSFRDSSHLEKLYLSMTDTRVPSVLCSIEHRPSSLPYKKPAVFGMSMLGICHGSSIRIMRWEESSGNGTGGTVANSAASQEYSSERVFMLNTLLFRFC